MKRYIINCIYKPNLPKWNGFITSYESDLFTHVSITVNTENNNINITL